jgi:hypothetical protein
MLRENRVLGFGKNLLEYLRLVDGILQGVMRKLAVPQVTPGDASPGSLFPGEAGLAHNIRLDIYGGVTERVTSQIAVKIVTDEHPIKRSIEGQK